MKRENSAKYWSVVPAAGMGKRMGSHIPKQYLALANEVDVDEGKTRQVCKVIDFTLQRLLSVAAISKIVVCIAPEDDIWRQTYFADHPRIITVDGGVERCHSVLNGLNKLSEFASADDWVLVHDVARPCVRIDDIERLIYAVSGPDVAQNYCGGILGMPVRDTMKRTGADNQILNTVERDRMWHALTPQMFRVGKLKQSLESALARGEMVTDEASALESCGEQPLMVEGAADNIKITRPEDLELARLYLSHQTCRQ